MRASIERDPATGVDILTSAILDFAEGTATFTCGTRLETDQQVDIYGTTGRISIGIPFNIPPDRPTRVFVTAGGDPPVAPATEVIEFPGPIPTGAGRRVRGGRARRDTAAVRRGRRGRQPARHRRHLRGGRQPLVGPNERILWILVLRGRDRRRSDAGQSIEVDQVGILAVAAIAIVVGAGLVIARPWQSRPSCPPTARHPEWTVARRWDEALLGAIRRALPAPTVHARNLYHTSAGDVGCLGGLRQGRVGCLRQGEAVRVECDRGRNEAMRLRRLSTPQLRYIKAVGGDRSLSEFADVMDSLCYPLDVTTTDGRLARRPWQPDRRDHLAAGMTDGSNQADGYAAETTSRSITPLVVASTEVEMTDRIAGSHTLEHMISQNGIPIENGTQQAVGPHWGHVSSFAIPPAATTGVPIDPGPPPRFGTGEYKDQAVEVIRDSSLLDPANTTTIDISRGPGATTRWARTTAAGTTSTRSPGSPTPPMSSRRATSCG